MVLTMSLLVISIQAYFVYTSFIIYVIYGFQSPWNIFCNSFYTMLHCINLKYLIFLEFSGWYFCQAFLFLSCVTMFSCNRKFDNWKIILECMHSIKEKLVWRCAGIQVCCSQQWQQNRFLELIFHHPHFGNITINSGHCFIGLVVVGILEIF